MWDTAKIIAALRAGPVAGDPVFEEAADRLEKMVELKGDIRTPSPEAESSMNSCTDDTSWVFVQQTGEKWVMSVWDDHVHFSDAQGRGWHWVPDPRPPKV